jgi:serine/threonine protein kinase
MSEVDSSHPSPAELVAFGLGRMEQAEASAIKAHLTQCETCRMLLGVGEPDTVPPPEEAASHTPQPASPQAEAAGVHEAPTAPPIAPSGPVGLDVPQALIDHPRYRVLEVLGKGGMGCVYKAEHRVMERLVALKVISRSLTDNPTAIERFHLEVKAAARLAHPNIVVAHDAEQAGDTHFLVMEYVEGLSLDRVVRKHGRLPPLHACEYMRQAALGLQHAFEKGMVHRDIKPQNLMLGPRNSIKILDFGLARFVSESNQGRGLTALGVLMGTPDFIAPEQAIDSRQADIRADIYSLGCTLYYLLTGAPPFPEGTSVQKVIAHLEAAPRPVTSFRADVPQTMIEILERMLAKKPALRYQTPLEVAKELGSILKTSTTPIAAPQALPAHAKLPSGAAALQGPSEERAAIIPIASEKRSRPATKPRTVKSVRRAMATKRPRKPSREGPARSFLRSPLTLGALACLLFVVVVVLSIYFLGEIAGSIFGLLFFGWLTWVFFLLHRRATDQGELVISADRENVRVVLEQQKPVVRVITPELGRRIPLKSGSYVIRLVGHPDLRLSSSEFELARGELVNVYVIDTVEQVRRFDGHSESVKCVAFSPDRRLAISGGDDKTVRVWDVETGQELRRFDKHADCINAVALSGDGRLVLSASNDRTLRLWDVETTREVRVFAGHNDQLTSLAISPVTAHAASGSRDTTIRLWHINKGEELCVLDGHTKAVTSLAFSPEGSRLLSGSLDHTVRLWSVERGMELARFEGHTMPVRAVAFASEWAMTCWTEVLSGCSLILSGSDDGSIRLWDPATGAELGRFKGHADGITSVAFCADASRVLSASCDRTLRLWDGTSKRVRWRRQDSTLVEDAAAHAKLLTPGWTGRQQGPRCVQSYFEFWPSSLDCGCSVPRA